ncbi:MAG: RHS repeat-associated core domain-containing protein, partial [Acetatifactor sp.]|nr:RHS repeat-associated core domain-containing protein [Acetatifactor sp.]
MDCIYEVDDYTNGIANPTILSYNESTGIQGNTGFIVEKSPITGYYNRKGYNYEYNHNDIKGNSDIREEQIYAISNNNTNTIYRDLDNDFQYTYSYNSYNDSYSTVLYDENNNNIYSEMYMESNEGDIWYSALYGNQNVDFNTFTFDKKGNISEVYDDNDDLSKQYSYDPHGRLVGEYDYHNLTASFYNYNDYGNIESVDTYELDSNGDLYGSPTTENYTYNSLWPDQLTSINSNTISYDNAGNPVSYLNGMTFTWEKGRLLSEITFSDNSQIYYRYDSNNMRVEKENSQELHEYYWDNKKLVREIVTNKSNNKKYDIWYIYNSTGDIAGFEYMQVDAQNQIVRDSVFFELDYQRNVVGLLNKQGVKFASYEYDSWGNIINMNYNAAYLIPFSLNSITYRGYYRDKESGLYYLLNRYYDPNTRQFINSDNFEILDTQISQRVMDNLYIYCDGDPINKTDPSGEWCTDIESFKTNEFFRLLGNGESILNTIVYIEAKSARIINKYEFNCALYNQYYDKVSGPKMINGQLLYPISNLRYGLTKISGVGCEIIATYNALVYNGKDVYFPDIIMQFELNNMEFLYGYFGSWVHKISDALDYYNVDYITYLPGITNLDDFANFSYIRHQFIISFEWPLYIFKDFNNSLNTIWLPSIHTVFGTEWDNKLTVYNYYGDKSIPEIFDD